MTRSIWITSIDVARRAGITYRQVDYWVRTGLLRPDNPHGGQGCPREWPIREVRIAEAMGQLVDAGIPLPRAAEIARASAGAKHHTAVLGRGVTLILDRDARERHESPLGWPA